MKKDAQEINRSRLSTDSLLTTYVRSNNNLLCLNRNDSCHADWSISIYNFPWFIFCDRRITLRNNALFFYIRIFMWARWNKIEIFACTIRGDRYRGKQIQIAETSSSTRLWCTGWRIWRRAFYAGWTRGYGRHVAGGRSARLRPTTNGLSATLKGGTLRQLSDVLLVGKSPSHRVSVSSFVWLKISRPCIRSRVYS